MKKGDDVTKTTIREIELRFKGPRRLIDFPLTNATQAATFLRPLIGDDVRENLVAIYLDGRHQPVGWRAVARGTATAVLAGVREVFHAAVELQAVAFVVGHNHPSGDPLPSAEDLALTQRLVQAGEIMGITLLDHIIIGEGESFYSLRENTVGIFD